MEEKSLKIELPINNRNAELMEETAKVLEFFKGMAEKGCDKDFSLWQIRSLQGCESWSNGDKNLFNNDAIQKAIPYIKDAGYFVWHHTNASGQDYYWFTVRDVCPHQWYRRL